MTACSAKEAEVWRSHLATAIQTQSKAVASQSSNVLPLHSSLTAEMKSIGLAFGKPGSFVRRMSVHRTATVGPTTDMNQVIIKNTQASKYIPTKNVETLQIIPRSQSVLTPSHVQTLTPRRTDRIKLEAQLADVWSPKLPFPGMTPRRTEQLRGSANHVMRKLSMASITSTFYSSKRHESNTSMTKLHREAEGLKLGSSSGRSSRRENAKPARLDLSEILPADFDLKDHPNKKRKNALRTLTMTMERPFSPLLGLGSEGMAMRRAQSVRDRRPIDINIAPCMTSTERFPGAEPHESLLVPRNRPPVQPENRSTPLADPNPGPVYTVQTENALRAPQQSEGSRSKHRLRKFFV